MTLPDIAFHILMPIYIIGFVLNGLTSGLFFALESGEYGDKKSRQRAAKILIATPLWFTFWGAWIIKTIADAAKAAKEEEEA